MTNRGNALLSDMRLFIRRNQVLVFVDLAGKRRIGLVTEVNLHTTWVKIMMGAKSYILIKRHNKKHNIAFYRLNDEKEDT